MPRQHPKWHTAHAMAAYIAQNTELPLCAASLAAVIRDRMPEAAPVEGGRLLIEDRVYDPYADAQIRRGDPEPDDRSTRPALLKDYRAALEGWQMPECPACRGRALGHSCGADCQSPHKEWLVFRRSILGLGPPTTWRPEWTWPPAIGEWGGGPLPLYKEDACWCRARGQGQGQGQGC